MYDDLINALKTCLSDASCAGCIYQDERECNEMLKTACLEAITRQDSTIAYLMALNSKLSNELQNSLDLKREVTHKKSEPCTRCSVCYGCVIPPKDPERYVQMMEMIRKGEL